MVISKIEECFEIIELKNKKLGINFGLERVINSLNKLKNPQNNYKSIHITGTNGKGSTTTMISSILHELNYKIGTFISPKIHSYIEMFLINGKEISEDIFIQNFNEIYDVCYDLTAFEFLTVLAFNYFKNEQIDYAVVEVGCGGLLDATNVLLPVATVITNISDDHKNILGDIVKHKLGIIKKGVPLITGIQDNSILRKINRKLSKDIVFVYKQHFNSIGEKILENSQIVRYEDNNNVFIYEIPLLGDFQIINSAIAIKTCLEVIENIDFKKVQDGLLKTKIHYRFEKINFKDKTFVLDGAHNLDGMRSLSQSLHKYFKNKAKTIIIGILKDKAYEQMIKEFIEEKDTAIFVKPISLRACDPEILYKISNCSGKCISNNYEDAINRALKIRNDLIVITGTFYNDDAPIMYLKKLRTTS